MSQSLFELTEEHVEEFYREGFFYAPSLISVETVAAINREYEEITKQSQYGSEWKSYGFNNFEEHAPIYPVTAQFLSDSRLNEMFKRILGGDTKLWLGMYAVVAPGGKGLEWHQDNMYTHILGHMLNAFVALDYINQENAGLWIAPRTHRLGRQENLNVDGREGTDHKRAAEPENGLPCPEMKPGDAVIFHRETLHHSKGNHTDKPRRAYAFQVANANCRLAESGKQITRFGEK